MNVVIMFMHLSRIGVDGGECLRRALCELATMPSLRLQGVVGEMIDVLLRYVPPTGSLEVMNLDNNEGIP